MATTRANENRAIRQEALREQLSNKGLVQKVLENLEKIEQLDTTAEDFNNCLQKFKISNDQRLKLVNKYLPDLKLQELTGEGGGAIQIAEVQRTIVDPKHTDS